MAGPADLDFLTLTAAKRCAAIESRNSGQYSQSPWLPDSGSGFHAENPHYRLILLMRSPKPPRIDHLVSFGQLTRCKPSSLATSRTWLAYEK